MLLLLQRLLGLIYFVKEFFFLKYFQPTLAVLKLGNFAAISGEIWELLPRNKVNFTADLQDRAGEIETQ